jgi:thioesterase domain-containing protein
MALQLRAAGESVGLLATLDATAPSDGPRARPRRTTPERGELVRSLRAARPSDRPLLALRVVTRRPRAWLAARTLGIVRRDRKEQAALLFQAARGSMARYRARPFPGPAVLVAASGSPPIHADRWKAWLPAIVDEFHVRGDHHSMLREPDVAAVAEVLLGAFRAAERPAPGAEVVPE